MSVQSSGNHGPNPADPLGAGFDFSDPNSPLAPYYLPSSSVVAVALFAFLSWFYGTVPLWHTDVWAHLKYGEWIWDHHTLPEHEPFTPYADKQLPLMHFQWLTQLLYKVVFRLGQSCAGSDPERRFEGGVEALRFLHLGLLLGRFFFLWLSCRRVSGSIGWANFGLSLLFVEMIAPSAIQRPQMVGMFWFALLLAILSKSQLRPRDLILIPLIMLFWANMHGSFPVGLATLVIFGLASRFEKSGATQPGMTPIRVWLGIFLAAVLAIGIFNPHGPWLYLHVVQFPTQPNLRDLDEWQPLHFGAGQGGHWAYLASWFLVVFSWLPSPQRWSPTRIGLMSLFGIWPLFQERAMIWWLMLVPWFIAGFGSKALERLGHGDSVPKADFRKTLLVGLIVLVALLWLPPIQWLIRGRPRISEQSLSKATCREIASDLQGDAASATTPGLADILRRYPQQRFQGTIFTSETLGEYLLWAMPSEYPILVYTHAHLFPVDHWRACMAAKNDQGDWREWLRENRVLLIAIEPDLYPKLAAQLRLDPTWQVLVDEAALPGFRLRGDRKLIAIRRNPLPFVGKP